MASNTTAADPGLPPDLFDQTTLVSLASTVVILAVAYGTSLKALAPSTPSSYRFLFIWHAFDALIHFFLEGSFLYHASRVPDRASGTPQDRLTDNFSLHGRTVLLQLDTLR